MVNMSPGMEIKEELNMNVMIVDYHNAKQAMAFIHLLDEYARDPLGGGEALTDEVKQNIVPSLAAFPGAFSVLAYDGEEAIGLVNCFYGFSTFACRKIINIHDVVVKANYRGQAVCQQMFDYIERIAREQNCCKLTLEVLQNNESAQRAYRKCGFNAYQLLPEAGHALFWQKVL